MENISESDIVVQERIYYQAGRVEVFKVKHIRTGRTLCMKKVFVNNIQEATAMQSEYLAMATLQHENIVKLVSASLGGQDKTITHLLIFSEYCEEGDLENLIKRCATHQYYFPEDQLISYLEMLVDAFLYMQNKNLAHRDIKPQNIFVCENATKLKVGDLGSVSQQEDSVVNNIVGTPLYLSPILREAYSRNVQFGGIPHDVYKSDVYSLGLTFLYLSSLSPVNDLINLSDMERKTEQRILALRKSYPRLSEILKGMLMKDEYFRFDYTNIKYRVNRGRTVLELLDTKNYEKITRQGKGKIEFSNLKCHGCLTIQNEDDLFVYVNGLLCKTCRESLVQNPEKEKL